MWIKQNKQGSNIVALYSNIVTKEEIYETKCGQSFTKNTHKLCDKPTDFYIPKDFGPWGFYVGSADVCNTSTIGSYCCDGDGIVSVKLSTDGFIRLYDQGTYVRRLNSDIDEAMKQATRYVRRHYREIYELCIEDLSA
jgi:hypothetical protein